jgi:hypothetical protein
MANDVGQDNNAAVLAGHQVLWFAPDRPTGGTVFARPSDDPVQAVSGVELSSGNPED